MKIRILPDNKEMEIETTSTMTMQEILSKLDLDLDDVLVVVNGKVVEDPNYIITRDAEVKLVRVGSGG